MNKIIRKEDYIECPICSKRFRNLSMHIIKKHKMTVKEFRKKFGMKSRETLSCDYLYRQRSECVKSGDAFYSPDPYEFY